MRIGKAVLVAVMLVAVALVGCSKEAEPTPTLDTGGNPAAPTEAIERELTGANRLVLGTLMLEGTADAVTPTQAADLLPLWQMMAGDSLQGDAETQAVLKQIEGKMTDAQLAAIEAMELTGQSWQTWMQEQGIETPAMPQGGQGGAGGFGDMSEEERTKMREELQNMSQEERATRMAEMGVQRPEGGGQGSDPNNRAGGRAGGAGGLNLLFRPLIELLTERAAQ